MHLKKYFFILFALFSNVTFSQKKVYKKFSAEEKYGVGKIILDLYSDFTFRASVSASISGYVTDGVWTKKNNSYLFENKLPRFFPIEVRESQDTALTKLKFRYVMYTDSMFETAAYIKVNEKGAYCVIGLDTCNYRIGEVKSFVVKVFDQYYSEKYFIKNEKTNVIQIFIKSDYYFSDQMFFRKANGKIVNGKLYLYLNGGLIKMKEIKKL